MCVPTASPIELCFFFFNFYFLLITSAFAFQDWYRHIQAGKMQMESEIKFAQSSIPSDLGEPLQEFPFHRGASQCAKDEAEFIGRYKNISDPEITVTTRLRNLIREVRVLLSSSIDDGAMRAFSLSLSLLLTSVYRSALAFCGYTPVRCGRRIYSWITATLLILRPIWYVHL